MRNTTKTRWLMLACIPIFLFTFAYNLSAQVDDSYVQEKQLCEQAEAAKNDGINWEPDLKSAMAKAKKLDKPVFIVFLCRFLGNCDSPYA
ncbi:MAG: hypothetical protein ACI97A_004350 [Planctomycetota bacterium]|jgi:hypothetical protein